RCHSFCQHFIEQPRTCRRKVQYVFRTASATATTATAFLTIQAGRVDIHRLLQITPADTEPLRPEIVRRTPLSQQRQRSFQLYPVARYLTEHQIKAVTQMLTTTKLADMTTTGQDRPALRNRGQKRRIACLPTRAIQTEPLHRHGMAVLQTTKTHLKCLAASQNRQFTSHVLRVVARFFNTNTQMLSGPRTFGARHFKLRPQLLGYPKAFRSNLQQCPTRAGS